jgi:osmotically-inducible protein OsmY
VINLLCVDVAHKIDDHELANSINAALSRARGLKDSDISVAIGEDMVVLSGAVEEPWQKEVAETVVGGFGLLHIRNELQVEGKST